MKVPKLLNFSKFNINIKLKDISLVLIGIVITVTFSQYFIPFLVKNLVHRNDLLDIKLYIIPETIQQDNLVEYYFRLENNDKNISLEDVNIYINFQSVIDKEVTHQDIGILGLQTQKGESIKNSNHANIKIEKIFPKGVLIITYSIRKERFGKAPFRIWDFRSNLCNIEYSYNYLGASIRRKIKKSVPKIVLSKTDQSELNK